MRSKLPEQTVGNKGSKVNGLATSTAAKLHTIASALDVSAHGNKEAVAFELSMTWRHPAVAFELSMTWRRPGVPRANLSLES